MFHRENGKVMPTKKERPQVRRSGRPAMPKNLQDFVSPAPPKRHAKSAPAKGAAQQDSAKKKRTNLSRRDDETEEQHQMRVKLHKAELRRSGEDITKFFTCLPVDVTVKRVSINFGMKEDSLILHGVADTKRKFSARDLLDMPAHMLTEHHPDPFGCFTHLVQGPFIAIGVMDPDWKSPVNMEWDYRKDPRDIDMAPAKRQKLEAPFPTPPASVASGKCSSVFGPGSQISANGSIAPYEDDLDPEAVVSKFMKKNRAIAFYIWQTHVGGANKWIGKPTKAEKSSLRRAVSAPNPGVSSHGFALE
ncbi:hypothetical protein HK097_007360 [Rhizophlyctis rosea]|uniref:Uncharacterized protein n=1 Tax=Rhizophlyctis rosea TaxID=64517 RepID=A0AAD5SBR4_9FUNG|nr:hypothetical protein HK097_007360 [Rhizophlyctis rosea]